MGWTSGMDPAAQEGSMADHGLRADLGSSGREAAQPTAPCRRLLEGCGMPPRFRALLVEDEEADALYVRFLLENPQLGPGYELLWVSDCRDLEEVLRAWQPEVVVVDLGLPGCTGPDACARALGATEAAVVVLTGGYDEALALHALALGAQDFLLKDELDALVLERALRYAIERQRIRRRLAVKSASSSEIGDG